MPECCRGWGPGFPRLCATEKKEMVANLGFAARRFGGKCERGHPPFTKRQRPTGTRRRAPKARKGVAVAGAQRRAVSGRGPQPKTTEGSISVQVHGPVRKPLDGWMRGLEPPTTGTTIRCSAIELHPPSKKRPPAGAPGRIRTPDPRLRRPPLCPTELLALPRFVIGPALSDREAPARRGERI